MLYLNSNLNIPLYQQIYEQIRSEILSGELVSGSKLTPIRTLSKELCVSRNTVENAYQQLLVEGYVYAIQGSGYIISKLDSSLGTAYPATHMYAPVTNSVVQNKSTKIYADFTYGSIREDMFPKKTWKKHLNEALRIKESQPYFQYTKKQGEHQVRQTLVQYLKAARGVNCKKEQLVLCSSLQQCLEIAALILPSPTYRLGMEEPGHIRARVVFESRNYKISPIPVNREGISIDELYSSNANLVYITPSHQFPYGSVMPIRNRQLILQWANKVDGYIIEDDYDSEFRYNSKPIPCLQSFDTESRTIYIGTFSKSLSPDLRIAYIVLPEVLLPAYHKLYRGYHCSVPLLYQMTLNSFIADGSYEKHIRKMNHACQKNYDALISSLKGYFQNKIRIIEYSAGMHLLIQVFSPLSQNELLIFAENAGVKIYLTEEYWMDLKNCPTKLFMLGFGSLTEQEIREGVKRLYNAWFSE